MIHRILLPALLILAPAFIVAEDKAPDAPKEHVKKVKKEDGPSIEQPATLTGLVVDVDANGLVSVKPAVGEVVTLRPRWIGGKPKDGGGMDKDMLELVKKLLPGAAVTLTYGMEEGPRLLSLAQTEAGKDAGTASGKITRASPRKISVQTETGVMSFAPDEKAGKDLFKDLKTGDKVEITWTFKERGIASAVKVTEAAPAAPEGAEKEKRERKHEKKPEEKKPEEKPAEPAPSTP